eukprot:TRINITY_DN15300_c0_g1_i1.p1 TRINITY_DN15300_c0_g1~~TRINITY_DN15300_c0_g1_i1.p1  ORF type:complete len:428 (+),score=80.12 TRINITY_DN15300_c0_g1_i1:66-1286(+)
MAGLCARCMQLVLCTASLASLALGRLGGPQDAAPAPTAGSEATWSNTTSGSAPRFLNETEEEQKDEETPEEQDDEKEPSPDSVCSAPQTRRRRRASDMCSCRRRTGASSLKKGWACQDNVIKPCGSSCPVGYSPPVDFVKSPGRWCEIAKPKDSWRIEQPAYMASPGVSASGDGTKGQFKVLSYNLFWWNLFGVRGGNGRSAGAKIASGSKAGSFDVIGFQECDDITRILADAKEEGLEGDYVGIDGGRALGVAYLKSKWNFLSAGSENVGEDAPQEYYGLRSAQWVRLQRKEDGKTVFFANHHGPLPVSCGGGCTGSSTAYNILGMIASNMHKGDVVVLVGDFNAKPQSSRIQALDRHLHRVYSGSAHGGVDHIFCNGNGSAVLATENLGSGGSDHDAITATLLL